MRKVYKREGTQRSFLLVFIFVHCFVWYRFQNNLSIFIYLDLYFVVNTRNFGGAKAMGEASNDINRASTRRGVL